MSLAEQRSAPCNFSRLEWEIEGIVVIWPMSWLSEC